MRTLCQGMGHELLFLRDFQLKLHLPNPFFSAPCEGYLAYNRIYCQTVFWTFCSQCRLLKVGFLIGLKSIIFTVHVKMILVWNSSVLILVYDQKFDSGGLLERSDGAWLGV
jgi:hypothetical protein